MAVRLRLVLLPLGMLVMIPVVAAAQSKATVGIKAGVNIATISSSDSDTSSILGAVGGVFFGSQINDRVGVQVEGLYSQQGAKDKTPGSDVKYRVNYFNVPVLARFGNTTTNTTHFHVFTGPQAGFKLNAKASSKNLGLTVDVGDEVKGFDFGWVLGAGVEMNRLTFDVRYTLGLTNISTMSGDTAKNRTFSAMAGIRLK